VYKRQAGGEARELGHADDARGVEPADVVEVEDDVAQAREALVGAALTGRVIRRFGIGPTYVATSLVAAAGSLFIPLAHGAPWLGMAMLILSQLIGDSMGTVAEICARSLRQSLVAPDLMGRVGGVFALAPGVTGIAGALLGGWLGGAVGERATLLIGSAGLTLAAALALASPLVRRREIALAPDLDGA